MFAHKIPMVARGDDCPELTVVEKKIVPKAKFVSEKSDVTRPLFTIPVSDASLSDIVQRHIRICIRDQKPSEIKQKKTKKMLCMPVLVFLQDCTVVRTTIPFVSRKRGLGVFENKKQRDTFISLISKGSETDVSVIDIAYRGDLLVISPSDHPMKTSFFKTCGVREVMEFDLAVEEIQFSHAYYFFPHRIRDIGLFADRQFDVPPIFDIGHIPEFCMNETDDETGSDSDEETETDVSRMYTRLYTECKRTSTSMYDVDRTLMSRPADSFLVWGEKKLTELRMR